MGDHNEAHICNAQRTERFHYLGKPCEGCVNLQPSGKPCDKAGAVQPARCGTHDAPTAHQRSIRNIESSTSRPGERSIDPSTALGSETNGSNSVGWLCYATIVDECVCSARALSMYVRACIGQRRVP
eukprot:5173590-Pyramimonas_sp.AAC.1